MNLLELRDKIKSHLLAGYPGLYIHSSEESRVDALLQEVSAQLALHPKEWNLGYGWVDFHNKQPRTAQNQATELADCLPSLLDDDLDGKLFIIKDARSALENQPLAVARLKQLLNRIQRHHRCQCAVVLVSEALHIPTAIEAQITLFSLSLPQGEEINQQLNSVCQALDLFVPENMHQRLHTACCGLNQEEIRSALAIVRQHHEQINDEALALIQHGKEQIIAKSGVLEMLRVSENATDIGGLENLKNWLTRRAQIFHRLSEAHSSRIQAPKGVLIAGMPGCGKSLAAKAASGLFQLPLLRLDIGSLLGKYVGESEHNMRRALTMAESVSPCILWIDELEKAFVGMNNGNGSEVSSRLFGYFLTWMQEKTGAVFVIATANNITALPPELLRKGRFDEVFYVGFPNAVERSAILDIHLKGEMLQLGVDDRNKLVAQCRDYAGADIQNAINEAREMAFLDNRQLGLEDLDAAIRLTVPLRETLREQVAQYEDLFEKLKLKPASTSDGLSVAQMIQMSESLNLLRRIEVADSKDCPNDLLEKLATDDDLSVRKAVYRNPNCPERVLTQRINIVEGHPEFERDLLHLACLHAHAPHDLMAMQFDRLQLPLQHRIHLAANSTDNTLLQHLINDPDTDVCEALTINRNLDKSMQIRLAQGINIFIRRRLAGNNILHTDVQEILARDSDFTVRENLAGLDGLSEAVQLILAHDSDPDVRTRLACRAREGLLPETVQLALAKDENDGVRQQLARNPHLSATIQLRLVQDRQVSVRSALADHPNLTSTVLQTLLNDTEEVLEVLARSEYCDSTQTQLNLSQHPSEQIRTALAGNARLQSAVQTMLAKDSNANVRDTLAGNDGIDDETISILMADSHDSVRVALVRWRKSLPANALHHLSMDSHDEVRRALACTPNLPEEVQLRLASDNHDVQINLAPNPQLSTTTQQQLLNNGHQDVHRALARNGNLTGPIMAQLAEMRDIDTRVQLAGNSALPTLVIDKLITDEQDVLLALATNSQLSEKQYARLYNLGSGPVRERLAANRKTGEALMKQIYHAEVNSVRIEIGKIIDSTQSLFSVLKGESNSPEKEIVTKTALALAANASLPETLQHKILSQSGGSVELLQALASNASLCKTVQHELVMHNEPCVREALAANENTDREILHELLYDEKEKVRIALLRSFCTDREIEWQLAQDRAISVRCAVASQSPGKAVQKLLAEDPEQSVRSHLISNEYNIFFTLNESTQTRLARDKDLSIRLKLAAYVKLHPSAQAILAKDEAVNVREALAKGSDDLFSDPLSEDVQRQLANDRDFRIRMALAKNPHLAPEIQLLLASDVDTSVKKQLIDEPWSRRVLHLQTQKVLAKDPDVNLRSALAESLFNRFTSRNSSQEILMMLASDPSDMVRNAIIWLGVSDLTYSIKQFNEEILDCLLSKATNEQIEGINQIRKKNQQTE